MRTALLPLLAVVAWAPAATAQTETATPARSIAEIVPADAWAFVEFAGLAACRQAAERTGLFALGRDLWARGLAERLQRRAGISVAELAGGLQAGLRRAGFDPGAVRALLQGPAVLAIGRPTMKRNQMAPSVLAAFDVRGREAAARSVLESAQAGVQRLGLRRVPAARVVLGVPVTAWIGGRGAVGEMFHAVFDGRLLLSNSFGFLEDSVRTWRGERPSVAADRGLGQAFQHVRGRPLANVWVSLRPFTTALAPFLPYESRAVGEALGVLDAQGVLLSWATEGPASRDVFHLGVKGPAEGLIRQAFGLPASARAAKACPPDTLIYFTWALDPRGSLDALARAYRALPVREEISRELRRETGADVEQFLRRTRRLLEGVGKEITLAMPMPLASGIQPSFLAVLDVTDAEAVRRTLDSLPGLSDWKRARFREHTIRYAQERVRVGRGGGGFWRPAYAVTDEFLVAGTDVPTVKAALRRLEGGGRSLADEAEFREARRRVPEASALGVVRLRALVREVWDTVRLGLAVAVQQEDPEFDPETLPDAEELESRVTDLVAGTFADDQGLTSIGRDPAGLGVWTALAGWALDSLLAMESSAAERSPKGKRKVF